ncbi:hypothetical protein JAAARDRAFT_208306 [Jaapia argillacea MUCL 33604]|uniref:Uncharacterized protein n=1 Tax=Jaapia argillacea MUCL 33604 TaxID=933084 RepID=A0A067PXT6_9AGAM|nr:hypothetical protein JAAARDRAFT_208306 [Jaapia argillacea MUCL 33604]
MSLPVVNVVQEHVDSGLYAELADNLTKWARCAPMSITRSTSPPPTRTGSGLITTSYLLSSLSLPSSSVTSATVLTALRSLKGNFHANGDQPIIDGTKVKYIFVLRKPCVAAKMLSIP